MPAPDLLRGTCQTAHRTGQAFGEPQAQPDGRQNQDHGKTEVEKAELKEQSAPFGFELLVEPDSFGGLVEQGQDFTVHIPADIEIAVGKGLHLHQRAEFVVGPILDDDKALLTGFAEMLRCGLLEIEQIGPVAACPDLAGSVDQIGFAQAALDLALPFAQKGAVGQVDPLIAGGVDAAGKGLSVKDQVFALFGFVGLCGGQRRADHAAHPVRKPALKTHVHRQTGKDRDRYGRDQRHQCEDTGQAQVQPRSCGFVAPRGDQTGHLTENKGRDQKDIDQIGQQHQPQGQRVCPLPQRTEHEIGAHGQDRAKHDQPQRCQIAHAFQPPQTAQLFDRETA